MPVIAFWFDQQLDYYNDSFSAARLSQQYTTITATILIVISDASRGAQPMNETVYFRVIKSWLKAIV